jgi:hypothetical protein
MKTFLWLGLACSTTLAANLSFADDKSTCLDAAAKGQRLRATHKLVDARVQLRVCASASCPSIVQSDCTRWLDAVEAALPTVVVTAKNAAGALTEAKLAVDGQPFAARLDGRATPIDPGPHTFHLETADGAVLDQQIVVPEGEQNVRVALEIHSSSDRGPTTTTDAAPSTPARGTASPWKTVGWVVGGAGIAALGVGAAFGLVAMNDKNDAQCNAARQCRSGPLADAWSAARVSDVAFVAGAALLAGGAAFVLFAPHASSGHESSPVASLRVAPEVGAAGGSLIVDGIW